MECGGNRDRWEARKRVRRNGIRKNMERRTDRKIYMDGQQKREKGRKKERETMKGRRV